MKKIFLALLLAVPATVLADVYVQPHVRSDGTYVQGYHRSDANESRSDNYSSRGNTNPYTGERGYRDPSYDPPQSGGRHSWDND
ncbi:hypothetical protein BH20PSE1_BH20PSE1_01430 [soil metagenome]